ncbi:MULTISPECIES: hypothetical protein [Pseudoalteromonas]|uniref:hypothetical protein n=1 Tax=Pseudoalteromonas TaxID=53246 RepID=UPI0002AAC226|nr:MULTISPECIES: hypothetical protein [unclassified Pseudoalteromonas]ALQ07394.1 hypothetical protein D172_004520 [Pseudoalteromonas sp. Bsw20308]KDC55676.1 hypothetical protein DO88_02425 [Pseudoalteromonas sp. S3431]
MADNFRVIFAGLADGIDSNAASINLADKLKTSEEKVALFFKGKPLFAPSHKDKALKQAKLLASLGIKSKLQAVSNAANTSTEQPQSSQRDERIFDALDYITSSLIRLEEKLEELEQRLPEEQSKNPEIDEDDDWQDDDLLLDEELVSTPKKRSNVLLYSLIATAVTLLIILAVYLAFPSLFSL